MQVFYRSPIGGPDAATVETRLNRLSRLWERYLAAGGSLAPEYAPSDPMHEIYLVDGMDELGSLPGDLVREDVDFESLIETTLRCDSLEAASIEIENFWRNLSPSR